MCVCVHVCVRRLGVECVISIHNTHSIHMTMYMYTVHAVQERSISNYTHVHFKKSGPPAKNTCEVYAWSIHMYMYSIVDIKP